MITFILLVAVNLCYYTMVNTFVTSSSVTECAQNLDYRRLGKQRLEAWEMINILEGKKTASNGYASHPAVAMWKGHVTGLKIYFNAVVDEWVARGYNNTMSKYVIDSKDTKHADELMPWWFSCPVFHLAHKCALLLKEPKHYSPLFVLDEKQKIFLQHGYIWPSKLTAQQITSMKAGLGGVELCEPLGSGIPPQHRIKRELIEQWIKAPTINPTTGRPIKASGAIYKDYEKAAKALGITAPLVTPTTSGFSIPSIFAPSIAAASIPSIFGPNIAAISSVTPFIPSIFTTPPIPSITLNIIPCKITLNILPSTSK